MKDDTFLPGTKNSETDVTRRHMLLGAAIATGAGVALLAGGQPAEAKMSQKAAKYQAAPKNSQQCSTCTHFKAPSSCDVVDGTISPSGWCQLYAKKS